MEVIKNTSGRTDISFDGNRTHRLTWNAKESTLFIDDVEGGSRMIVHIDPSYGCLGELVPLEDESKKNKKELLMDG